MEIQTRAHKTFQDTQTQARFLIRNDDVMFQNKPSNQTTLQRSCWDQEMLHTRIQDWLWTGMDRTKAGCWVWSPAPPQHPGRLSSSVLIHVEEEEEKEDEAGGHADVCCYTSGKFE